MTAYVMQSDDSLTPPGSFRVEGTTLYAFLIIGGVKAWLPISPSASHYVHNQITRLQRWVVHHNLRTENVIIQVNGVHSSLLPPETVVIDENTVELVFVSPVSGTCLVVASSFVETPSLRADYLSVANGHVVMDERGIRVGGQPVLTEASFNSQAGQDAILSAIGYTPEDQSKKNRAGGYAGLDASGKISASQIPSLSITNTFVVSSESEMLALTADVGDVAIRLDENKNYILVNPEPSLISNWQDLNSGGGSNSVVLGTTEGVALASTGAAGSATTAARSDHVHPYPTASQVGALPSSGGTITGVLTLASGFVENAVSLIDGNINMRISSVFSLNLTSSITLSITNPPPAGKAGSFLLELSNGGSYSITWPTGSRFAGGSSPVLTGSGKDVLICYTNDGGASYNWIVAARDVR